MSTFGGPGSLIRPPEGFEPERAIANRKGAHYADSPFRKDKPQSHNQVM